MANKVLQGILSALKQIWGFLFLLVRMPIERQGPDPAKEAAR